MKSFKLKMMKITKNGNTENNKFDVLKLKKGK